MNIREMYESGAMTKEGAYECLKLLFDGYKSRKRKKELYRNNDPIPRIIIETYYYFVDDPRFDIIFEKFKRKYIINENNLEQVHEPKERQGLGVVYDYIHSYIPSSNLNLFIILKLHQLLFSKVDYPEFGGKFRTDTAYLTGGSGVETCSPNNISSEITKLYLESLPLFKKGLEIGQNWDFDQLIPYINECIKLNVELIHIHPFPDGNGRTSRALTNLMFKLVDIPPVYVKASEREEYITAMNKAIIEKKYDDIITFYYYKICDSIVDLDNTNKKENVSNQKTLTKKK